MSVGGTVRKSVVVVGAGVGGLVAARELARSGFAVTVIDGAATAGGCVATHSVAGIRLDSGAESFATRGGTVADYLAELGLGDRLVTPNIRGAWLQLQGKAAPLPKNTLLGIPGVPLATDVRVILGWSGAIRAQLDRVLPFVRVRKEADLGDLVRRRMGRKVLDRLVAPVVSGVHSAHPDLVDVQAVAPGLTTAMTNQGSLSGAVMSLLARRGQAPADAADPAGGGRPAPGSAVGGIDGGMYGLVEALVADCERLGVNLQLGVGVESVRRVELARPRAAEQSASPEEAAAAGSAADADTGAAEWMTVLTDGSVLGSHGVMIAAGFRSALDLLRTIADAGTKPSVEARLSGEAPLDTDRADLAAVTRTERWPGSSAVTLATIVLDSPELDAAPRGTGVLVAEDVTNVAAKALTHATAKWPWLARNAQAEHPHRHVLRLSYGRGGQPAPPVSLAQALADASTLLGIPLGDGQVRGFALTDWRDSLAFATAGHRARVDGLVEAVHGHPGLEVCGAWISGTGLAYVIDGARVKARELSHRLTSS
ncbi:protoporphyrinogen/coproporphyrinogen oxidase [Subtercola endophyticus]|uniref:protoporphyrinogen/coproporphyrinogen oxidase n=1 Tax=Subtercola endophyticus TaxID=2895559 RepID=UPI001E40FB91|nr:FAD-dependent oxidoreductase [Subtercola endophyticus]UFS58410.1 FAD-dependent oxidoreductase [Subtercola endophyticus]